MGVEPLVPDYTGACVCNLVPALLEHPDAARDWLPRDLTSAGQIVMLVLDGLGWHQLHERSGLAPTLCSMDGRSIDSVAPTTTATALTSITTGTTPGEHGVVGYRLRVGGDVLNALRWTTAAGDARARIVPAELQPIAPFVDRKPPVITRTEFFGSGFTGAHLGGTRLVGYRVESTLVTAIGELVSSGNPFVYAYYDGIDKVAHEYGLGPYYDAELMAVDRLVGDVLGQLPAGVALVVTADHGQVHVGDRRVAIDDEVRSRAMAYSGEARFVWVHARPGRERDLCEAARVHEDTGWVATREQVIDEGWFGPTVSSEAAGRLGDVALVAREPIAYVDPDDPGPFLLGRHGSLTAAELHVPVLWALP